MEKELISLIIPAYNEEKVIERLLQSIKRQTYKELETVIVDDESKDNTVVISNSLGAKVFVRKHAERSVQRNFGAKMSKGKYLLFLDADMELTPLVLEECIEAIKKINIGAVAIPEKSIATNYWEKVKAFERSFYNESGDNVTDAARFFRRDVFEKVGGYDETITGPEDWDLPERIKKLGFKITRIKSGINHYERISSPFKVATKKYYYALTSHRYLKKHKISIFSAKTIYFLRPVFYKNIGKMFDHPFLASGMFFMFFLEQIAGIAGFLVGKIRNL